MRFGRDLYNTQEIAAMQIYSTCIRKEDLFLDATKLLNFTPCYIKNLKKFIMKRKTASSGQFIFNKSLGIHVKTSILIITSMYGM